MRILDILAIMLCLPFWLKAQSRPVCRNLVLEGSGMRGIIFGGALEEMQVQGMLDSVKRVAGTSGGGIAAVALAVGYSPKEVDSIVYHTEFRRFNDGRMFFIGGFRRFFKRYGWYRGDAFSRWIGKLVEDKTGDAGFTFRQLHERGGPDLYLTGTSLSRQRTIVFSYETYPDMHIRDAVRITMSVPLYFQAIYIDSAGKVIEYPRSTQGLDLMVDGGILANFPIRLFDNPRYLEERSRSVDTAYFFNPETIGIRIDSDSQIDYDKRQKGLSPFEINSFRDYIEAFYTLTLESLNRSSLSPEDWSRTISCSSMDIGPKVRHLSTQEKDVMVQSGRDGVKDFLKRSRQITE